MSIGASEPLHEAAQRLPSVHTSPPATETPPVPEARPSLRATCHVRPPSWLAKKVNTPPPPWPAERRASPQPSGPAKASTSRFADVRATCHVTPPSLVSARQS